MTNVEHFLFTQTRRLPKQGRVRGWQLEDMRLDMPTDEVREETRYPLTRGVYYLPDRAYGRWVYFAITSQGRLLDMWRARRGEADFEIVSGLSILLDIEDPLRTRLTLVRPTLASTASTSRHDPSSQRRA